ncbi:MAG: aminodeoxychorismate/anthranilate synthase component II [Candidatus Gracilibacteria bacterium]
MKTLIIDNYDSFTYNLYQYIAELKGNPVVKMNDKISLTEIEKIKPSHIVISPGPGTVTHPKDFGICLEVIREFGKKIPILGVCLGHQGIAHAFGGNIEHAPTVMHGKTSPIEHDGRGIFAHIPNPFTAMRYHSLCVSQKLPKELIITAKVKGEETIMGIRHSQYPIYGIQFHPESFQTPEGKNILKNFLAL